MLSPSAILDARLNSHRSPLVLSLSNDERPRSWFDKLTMSDATSSP